MKEDPNVVYRDKDLNEEIDEARSIMVCGWRSKWNNNLDHLAQRIDDIACSLLRGSNILFINSRDPEQFAQDMASLGNTPVPDEVFEFTSPTRTST